ncbi:Flp family type IVb pilin [Sphingorhabdus sp.]|uniref:Flp family type IVb pilin n=1 Tax=Sphingorhabdus sp. TaxID=1902408 RepID=UPI00391A228F
MYILITFILTFLANERGASAAEYALILAVIGSGVAVSVLTLGGAIGSAIERTAMTINSSR